MVRKEYRPRNQLSDEFIDALRRSGANPDLERRLLERSPSPRERAVESFETKIAYVLLVAVLAGVVAVVVWNADMRGEIGTAALTAGALTALTASALTVAILISARLYQLTVKAIQLLIQAALTAGIALFVILLLFGLVGLTYLARQLGF